MVQSAARRLCLWSMISSLIGIAPAALPRSAAELPAVSSLTALTRKSAYVFKGTVLAVTRMPPDSGNSIASVQITFRVDQGIFGVRTGQTLKMREWAGLWEAGERYRPGEQVVLFLHRPSRLGFTSPVGGGLGRFTIDRTGSVVLRPGQATVLAPVLAKPLPVTGKPRVSSLEFIRVVKRSGLE